PEERLLLGVYTELLLRITLKRNRGELSRLRAIHGVENIYRSDPGERSGKIGRLIEEVGADKCVMLYRAGLELGRPNIVHVNSLVPFVALVNETRKCPHVGLENRVVYAPELRLLPSVAEVLPEREHLVKIVGELIPQ